MTKKEETIKYLESFGYPNCEVVLPLDDFFQVNNKEFRNSELNELIGVNLSNQPSANVFYEAFNKIISDGKAEAIFVSITDDDPEEWFFTDTVYVISNESTQEIIKYLIPYDPDEVYEGWENIEFPTNLDKRFINKKIITLFWD